MDRTDGNLETSAAPAHAFLYGERLDFAPHKGRPKLFVCLNFVPRSGSNLLADLMRQTGILGFPLEYFSPANFSLMASRMPRLSLSRLEPLFQRRTSANGVFSFKWNSDFAALKAEAKAVSRLSPRRQLFIDRLDLDAQAKSYLVAAKTGVWARQKGAGSPPAKPDLTADEVRQARERLADIRERTLGLLAQVGGSVLTVYLEDLFERPADVVKLVIEHCGMSADGLALPSVAAETASSYTGEAHSQPGGSS